VTSFDWQEGLQLGIATLDDDHRRLLLLIRAILGLDPSDEPAGALLDRLRDEVSAHLDNEIALLCDLQHPEAERLAGQRREQETALLSVLAAARRRPRLGGETGEYLKAWLLNHIICHDQRLRPFLQAAGIAGQDPAGGGFFAGLARRLDFLTLRWRILMLAALPLLAVLAAGGFGIAERVATAQRMGELREVAVFSTRVAALVHELQRERGVTVLRRFGGDEQDLAAQRARTDAARAAFADAAGMIAPEPGRSGPRFGISLGRLDAVRSQHDADASMEGEVVGYYTGVIGELLQFVQHAVHERSASGLTSEAQAYSLLMRAKERAGRERWAGASALADGAADPESLRRLSALAAEQRVLEENFLDSLDPELARGYAEVLNAETAVERMRWRMLAEGETDVTPEQWFQAATARIEAMKRVEDALAARIIALAARLHDHARAQIGWLLAAGALLLVGVLGPTALLAASVVPPLTALHGAMRRLSAGERAAAIPYTELRDELGAMARAVAEFRATLVSRDLLSAQGRVEVSGLVRGVADNLPGIVFQELQTADGLVCTYVSEKVRHYTGGAAEAMIGRRHADGLGRHVHPEDAARLADEIAAATAAGRPLHTEFRTPPAAGGHWMRLALTPRATPDGATVWDGIALDVTDLKDSERQREAAAVRLRQLYKAQALTQLAGGMAHEINNLLQPIIGLSELALMRMPERSEARAYVANVLEAGQQARDLVAKVTSFSRIAPLQQEPVDIDQTIARTVDILRGIVPKQIALDVASGAPGAVVLANAGELQQVLMNLCTNAVHAIGPRSGRIEIATAPADPRDGRDRVRISVTDTGCGIPPEIIEHVFDPFFTTKEVGKGTGLGLALVSAIVTGFGGEVDVDSTVGEGTTFHLFLPLHPPPADES